MQYSVGKELFFRLQRMKGFIPCTFKKLFGVPALARSVSAASEEVIVSLLSFNAHNFKKVL